MSASWHRPTGLSGDYNGDSAISAADYITWRKSLGQSGIGLPADGSGNGTIDDADYLVWRNNFAVAAAASGGLAVGVPEPCGAALAVVTFLHVFTFALLDAGIIREFGIDMCLAGTRSRPRHCSPAAVAALLLARLSQAADEPKAAFRHLMPGKDTSGPDTLDEKIDQMTQAEVSHLSDWTLLFHESHLASTVRL